MLWVLFAILAVVAHGQLDSCTLKYYTLNSYKEQNNFTFLCYGNGEDCDVYYSPPGNGCNGGSLTLIGTVLENQAQFLTSEDDFELSGGFCSKNQIGVYHVDNSGQIIANLPRATEAGTKFNIPLLVLDSPRDFRCGLFALSSPANIKIVKTPNTYDLNVEAFDWKSFDTYIYNESEGVVGIMSDNPVIVSCTREIFYFLTTWQPVSTEPLLLTSYGDYRTEVVYSDCSTNRVLMTVKEGSPDLPSEEYRSGSYCQSFEEVDTDYTQTFPRISRECVFLAEPLGDFSLRDTCVSMAVLKDRAVVDVGLPASKFSTRFVKSDEVDNVALFSLSETTCTSFGNEVESVNLTWLEETFPFNVSFANWAINSTISQVECEDPILMIVNERNPLIPILPGYQQEEMWQPFFDSICTDPQSLKPAMMPSDAPSSTDGRSLVSCSIKLVTFFVIYLFSSSLL